MGTLHEELHTFMILPLWILLRMRNVSGKVCIKIKTHISCSINCVQKSYCIWDHEDKLLCSQTGHRWQSNSVQRICNLHAGQVWQEYRHTSIILNIIACPRQQWLCKWASTLHYMYTVHPVSNLKDFALKLEIQELSCTSSIHLN